MFHSSVHCTASRRAPAKIDLQDDDEDDEDEDEDSMYTDKSPQSHPHHRLGTSNEKAHDGDSEASSDPANKSDDEVSDRNDDLTSLNRSSLKEKISSEVRLHL